MRSVTLNTRIFLDLVGEVLRRGHSVRFNPDGTSMSPRILPGESTVISAVNPESVEVGDVVMVGCDRPRMHRVKRIDKDKSVFVTQGDACKSEDRPVTANLLLGKVVKVERSLILRIRWVLGRIRSAYIELTNRRRS